MSLHQEVRRGVLWSFVARGGQQLVQFVLAIAMARLLLPADFGLLGMLSVFVGFAGLFTDGGFSSALVQKQDLQERHVHSIFWFNVAIGSVLTLLMCVCAPTLARFYHAPKLEFLARGLSPTFILSSCAVVPVALMQKRMQFDVLARVSLIALLISGLTGITAAWLRFGVWSLVLQSLTYSAATACLSWLAGRWRPRLQFDIQALRELWRYTSGLTGYQIINYWARNADNLCVGRAFGSQALGLYSRAYYLMLLPVQQITFVVTSVMFPALSSIQDDHARVRSIYLRATSVVALLAMPMMMGLMTTAPLFVLVFLGPRWTELAPLLQILAIAGMVQSVCSMTGVIFTSQGRTDWMFWWGVFGGGFFIAAIMLGAWLGSPRSIAMCYAGASVLLFYPCFAVPGRLIGLKVSAVLPVIAAPLASSLLMALCVTGTLRLMPAWAPSVQLMLAFCVGVGSYFGFTLMLCPSLLRQTLAVLRGREAAPVSATSKAAQTKIAQMPG